jgi:hypothetical protein
MPVAYCFLMYMNCSFHYAMRCQKCYLCMIITSIRDIHFLGLCVGGGVGIGIGRALQLRDSSVVHVQVGIQNIYSDAVQCIVFWRCMEVLVSVTYCVWFQILKFPLRAMDSMAGIFRIHGSLCAFRAIFDLYTLSFCALCRNASCLFRPE